MAEAPAGLLWLGTDGGLVRFDTHNERYRFYGLADGVQDLEFNGAAVAALDDGRLVFGGVRGFNLFDPPVRRFELSAAAAPALGPYRRGCAGRQRFAVAATATADSRWCRSAAPADRCAGLRAQRRHPVPLSPRRLRSGLDRQWPPAGHHLHAAAAGQLHLPRAGHQSRWRVEFTGTEPAGARDATVVAPSASDGVRRAGPAGAHRHPGLAAAPAHPARARLLRGDPRARGTPETGAVGLGRNVLGLRLQARRNARDAHQ